MASARTNPLIPFRLRFFISLFLPDPFVVHYRTEPGARIFPSRMAS
jgi:hypothetical protein